MDDYESLSHAKWDCKYHVVLRLNHRTVKLVKHGSVNLSQPVRDSPTRFWTKGVLKCLTHCDMRCIGAMAAVDR